MEIVITVGVFAVLASGVILLVADPLASGVHGSQRDMAANLVQQGLEAARSIKDARWTDLTLGTHGVTRDGSGNWLFSGTSDVTTVGGVVYTRVVTVTTATRDAGNTLKPTGTVDPRTRLVNVVVSWTGGFTAFPRTVSQNIYFSDWETYDWTQTTDAHFNAGTKSNVTVSGTGTAGSFTLSSSNKTWSAYGNGTTLIHTTDFDWNSGTYASTFATGTGVPSSVVQSPSLAWTNYVQPFVFNETTDTDFIDGNFSSNTTAVADTGDLGAVVLNTQTDWAQTFTSPTTQNQFGVSAYSTSDAWSVGAAGSVFHWDGTSWSAVASGTTTSLNGVAVVSATETWAVGDKGGNSNASIIRWNGATWSSRAPSPAVNQSLQDISMLNPSLGWAVGDAGTALKWNGVNWVAWPNQGNHNDNLLAVATLSATNAWAVGASGRVWLFDPVNSNWNSRYATLTGNLNGITFVTPSLGWIVGAAGVIYKWNGVSWVLFQDVGTTNLLGVSCSSASSCMTVGQNGEIYQFNGTTWSLMTSPTSNQLESIVIVSSTRAFAVGDGGMFIDYGKHYVSNGIYYSNALDAGASTTWSTISWDPSLGASNTLTIATRTGPITCSGATACAGWSAWSADYSPSSGATITNPDNRYIQYRATYTTTDRATSARLNDITLFYNGAPAQDNYDLAMISANDGWGVGAGGGIVRWDGSGWSRYVPATGTFFDTTDGDFNAGVSATSTTTVTGTGTGASVALTQQTDWATTTPAPTAQSTFGISALSASDAWAVGALGTTNHWNGTNWTSVADAGSALQLNGVSMASATDTWAVGIKTGTTGTIVRWNGTAWASQATSPNTNQDLNAVSMLNPSLGWAIGAAGTIYKWNGVSWVKWTAPANVNMFGVATLSATETWAVGANGTVWRYCTAATPTVACATPNAWNAMTALPGNIQGNGITFVTPSLGWVAANGGRIFKWNGVSWVLFQTIGASNLTGISCSSASSCMAVGAAGTVIQYNGTTWTALTSPTANQIEGVVMFSSTSGLAVGDTGTFLDYGTHYVGAGDFYSQVFDASASTPWTTISWNQTTATSSTISVFTRSGPITCSGATSCAGWSTWSPAYSPSTGASIVSPANRFIQYRVSFTSTGGRLTTSSLADLTMTYNPFTPATDGLYGIGGVATNDLWAVGLSGNIVHWNGTSWNIFSSNIASDWHIDVECITTSDCRLVGGHFAASPYSVIIMRWNGAAWIDESPAMTGWMESIRYLSSTDIWAAGSAGRVLHNTGSGWTLYNTYGTTAWRGMWFVSPTDGWLVGSDGADPGTAAIRHWDGSSWSAVAAPGGTLGLQDVECANTSLCWAVGDGGALIKWDGASWSTYLPAGLTSQDIESVAVDGTDHAWAVAHATGFLEYRNTYTSSATWTSPIVDGGAVGTIWNSLSWDQLLPASTGISIATRTGPNPTCCTGWSAFSSELTNPGNSTITSPANQYFQYRVRFTSGDTVHTGTLQEVRMTRSAITTQPLYDVQGTAVNDVWAVGEGGTIAHYDGSLWSTTASGVSSTLRGVDAITSSNAVAVGYGGKILKWNGSSWSPQSSPTTEELYKVDMFTSSDGWAVGTNGTLIRWNGTSWNNATSSPTTATLRSVSMIATNDVFAVGDAGTIIHWNGTTWSTSASGTGNNLNDVHCLNASNCWAVGDSGTILYWNGTAWSSSTSPVVSRLNGVEWRSASEAWAVGDFGAILKYDGVSWSNFTSPTTRDLYAVSVYAPTDGWICGFGGELDKDPTLYQPYGVFTSSILDMDAATSTPMTAYWHATIPALTNVSVTGRVGPSGHPTPDGSWTSFASPFPSSDGSPISLGSGRYFQYQVTLSTSDTAVTPSFNDITVTYR